MHRLIRLYYIAELIVQLWVTAFDAFWLNDTPDTTWFVEKYKDMAPEKIF